MGKWLAATCKGLSVAAGPLGAIGEFALKLYDDKRSEERDAKLQELIVSGRDISREILEEVFELKNNFIAVREQLINGITGIRELLQTKQISVLTAEQLEALFTEGFIDENNEIFQKSGFVTHRRLKDELVHFYGTGTGFGRFLMKIEEGGFDTASLPSGVSNDVIIFQFLKELERRTATQKERIFRELVDDSPSSVILKAIHRVIREQLQRVVYRDKSKGERPNGTAVKGPRHKVKTGLAGEAPLAGILFFDIKDYSALDLDQMEVYHEYVMKALYEIAVNKNGELVDDYLYMNSWGDGIVLIHSDYKRLVHVGLELRDYFKSKEYQRVRDDNGKEKLGLKNIELWPRIAIHFGTFSRCFDNFRGKEICYGPTLVLPARIEPVTPAGRVWVTYRIKDFVEEIQKQQPGGKTVKFWEQGKRKLAKEFGVENIYEATWEGESEPLRLEDEIEPEAEGQEPEEFEGIDDDDIIRIKRLTNQNPIDQDITVCSRKPKDKKCPAKPRSLRAISEIAKNGESVAEDLKAARWIGHTRELLELIITNYKSGEPVTYPLLQSLYNDVEGFFQCLNSFDRKDGTWPDNKTEMGWPDGYLFWRVKDRMIDASNCIKSFMLHANKFKQFFDDKFKGDEEVDQRANINLTREVSDALSRLHEISIYISTELNNISDFRFNANKKALDEGFQGFNRFKFAQHLKKVTGILSDECEPIPSIWT